MMHRTCSLGAAFILLASCGAGALAQTQVTLTPSMDNTLFEESGDRSNGAGSYLFVGNTNAGRARRALIAFDLADALPDGAQVEHVEITLNHSRTIAGSVEVRLHRVARAWGEGASDAPAEEGGGTAAAAGDATWTHAVYDTDMWQNDGGDFESSPSAAFAIGAVGRYTAESTPELVEDVQRWVDDPSSNFGWILIADETVTPGAKRFDSRHHATVDDRPQLTVRYSSTTAAEDVAVPGPLRIDGAYPNPFSRSARLRYELDRTQEVALEIYDLAGRPVRTVFRRIQPAGLQDVELDGTGLAAGQYVYCLRASASRQCRMLTVLR